MKAKMILNVVCAFLLSISTFAQEKTYLTLDEVANSLKMLPPPPEPGSILFLWDQARYEWGISLRNTPRGEQAVRDANLSGDGVPKAFSKAFGTEISEANTPAIYKLVTTMREDAGGLGTKHAKEFYKRIRPFVFYKEDTSIPEHQAELSANGAYPSGHTAIGWATTLVLVEINPPRRDEILKRGYDMGESRIICGYHWYSDVEAGRLVASSVVALLHANSEFLNDLAEAKAEFARLSKEGKAKNN
jgi:acid phosphatase (class A)